MGSSPRSPYKVYQDEPIALQPNRWRGRESSRCSPKSVDLHGLTGPGDEEGVRDRPQELIGVLHLDPGGEEIRLLHGHRPSVDLGDLYR